MKPKALLMLTAVAMGATDVFAAAQENVIGDPANAAASGIRIYAQSVNTLTGFEIDGTYYHGFVTIYPDRYPVQYHVKPVPADGQCLFRGTRKANGGLLSSDIEMQPLPDGSYWLVPPPRGEGDLVVATNYFQVAEKVIWVDRTRGDDIGNDGTTNSPYASIQRAVTDVTDTKRTVIMVHPGEYDNNSGTSDKYGRARVYVSGNHQIAIRSVAGPEVTSIVGESDPSTLADPDYPGCGADACHCVILENKSYPITIKGFTLKSGRSAATGDGATGGALLAIRDERLEDCVITNCVSTGSVVVVSSGTVGSVTRCRFYDNTAYDYIVGGNGCSFSYFRGNTIRLAGSGTTGAIKTKACNCTAIGVERSGCLVGGEIWDSVFDGGATLYSSVNGGGDVFFRYRNKYINDANMTSVRYEDPLFFDPAQADAATEGFVCSHSPAVGLGETFTAAACRDEFWKYFNGDIEGCGMAIDVNGRTIAGAFQRTLRRCVVSIPEPANGGIAIEDGFDDYTLGVDDTLTVHPAGGTRPCAGIIVNGVETNLFETAPSHQIVLSGAALGSGDFIVQPYYTTDWYVDVVHGSGEYAGGFPSAALQNLTEAAQKLASGDTLHVLPGRYDSGYETANDRPCRVVVKQGTRIVSTEGPEKTFIVGGTGVRCAKVNGNAELSGFTLTGADIHDDGGYGAAVIGSGNTGGRNPSNGYKVSNCVIAGNRGERIAYACLLVDCIVTNNVSLNSSGSDTSVGYQISAYGSYFDNNVCSRLFEYCFDIQDVTVTTNNSYANGNPSVAVYNCVDGGLTANSLLLLSGSYNASASVTNSVLVSGSTIGAQAKIGDDVTTGANAADYPLDANGAPVVGRNPAVDRAKPEFCTVFPRGEKDARGFQRVMNGRGDIGALEADWRPVYAEKMCANAAKPSVTVTAATAAVEADLEQAGVTLPPGHSIAFRPRMATSSGGSFTVAVTGTGTVTVTEDGVPVAPDGNGVYAVFAAAGDHTVEVSFDSEDSNSSAKISDFAMANTGIGFSIYFR